MRHWPVVFLMGPTASGKTALALALAERFPAEIISVDSALVYRGMDIGTAKPSAEERQRVAHHLIDILDPAEPYSAARFAADAHRLVGEIRARNRLPLLVGGTMLYFHTLLRGLSDLPSASPEVRARLAEAAAREGWPALHRRLQALDPVTAARLAANDRQRIQRALEIIELTGRPASAAHAQRPGTALVGPVVRLALSPPDRAVLHQRIRARFEDMMAQGFLDEVARLRACPNLHPDLPSMRAVGYRQLWAHLDGKVDLATAVEQGVAATRQLAKRQLTWLRADKSVIWLDPQASDTLDRASELVLCGAVET